MCILSTTHSGHSKSAQLPPHEPLFPPQDFAGIVVASGAPTGAVISRYRLCAKSPDTVFKYTAPSAPSGRPPYCSSSFSSYSALPQLGFILTSIPNSKSRSSTRTLVSVPMKTAQRLGQKSTLAMQQSHALVRTIQKHPRASSQWIYLTTCLMLHVPFVSPQGMRH